MARGKSPFKFENMWLKTEGFVKKVQFWWNCYSFYGTPSFVLARKLKALKEDIHLWNLKEFGNVGVKKKRLLEELVKLDRGKERSTRITIEENMERDRVILKVKQLASLEEISLRQKFRVLWLKEGDNNSKFFHQMAKSHRRNNYLGNLEVDGVVYEDEAKVVAQVVSKVI